MWGCDFVLVVYVYVVVVVCEYVVCVGGVFVVG